MSPRWVFLQKSLLYSLFAFLFTTTTAWAQVRQVKKTPPPSAKDAGPQGANLNQSGIPNPVADEAESKAQFNKDKEGPDLLQQREAWFYKQRSSANGRIPAGMRWSAFQHMQRMMEAEGKLVKRADGSYATVVPEAGLSSTSWVSIGPTPTTSGSYGPVTGRITAIAIDPSDATGNTVLIGGAQGGIWRTTDGGTSWTPVGDQNPSLAMGSIAFAPSQPATVYAGTGEQAAIGFDIYYGAGVFKSANSGQTWAPTCTVAGPSCPFIGPYSNVTPFGYFTLGGTRISYISVNPSNPQMVLVGAQTQFAEGNTEGVYCSDNGGLTWSNILPDEMSTFVGFANSTVAYAALGNPFGSSGSVTNGNGIYKATGIGATCATIAFSRLTSTGLPLQSTMGRIDLGIALNDTTGRTVYASISDGSTVSSANLGVYLTTDGGANWTKTGAPDVCQPQCWYDNVIKVDPTNNNIAFLAGAASATSGVPGWVVRSSDGGAMWPSILPNAAGAGLPHPDSHAMAFLRLSTGKVRMYLGNDGGIWRTDDAEASAVTWTNLNNASLTLSQFYPAISTHPSSPTTAIGGTQDNGTQVYSGTLNWQDIGICGDGSGTAIDNVVPSTVYIACNGLNILASYQNGVPSTSFNLAMTGINTADTSSFVPPLLVDPNAANTVYTGTTKVYQSVDAGNIWTSIAGDLVRAGGPDYLNALTVAPGNSAVMYAGSQTGVLLVATNVAAGSATFSTIGSGLLPTRTITAIAVDPSVPAGTTAYVAYSGFSYVNTAAGINDPLGQIFKTTDGGATWGDVSCSVAICTTRATTDLPNVPVNDIVVDPDVAGTIYAATDLGVFIGNCTVAPCTWGTLGTGLPRVAVLSLKLHEASRTLRAATHGRGLWDIALGNLPSGPHIASITPTSAGVGGAQLTLTVNGSGLTGGAIQFAGTDLVTTGTPSDTSISGTLPTSLLTTGAKSVTVNVGTVTSNSLTFVVLGGVPTLTSISPPSTPVQPTPTTNIPVTLTGTNFASNSQVYWNGAAAGITVKLNSSTSITATLPAALLGPYGSTDDISVVDPPPGGGQSQAIAFKVTASPPPNDNFANAINITSATFMDDEDSSGATTETSDPTPTCAQQFTAAQGNTGGHANGAYNTIWYKYTPTLAASLNVDTIGSSSDSVLSIWTGTQGALSLVACNDDITPGVVLQSQLSGVPLVAGTTYYIMVGSFGPPAPNPVALGGHSHLNFTYNGGVNPPPTLTSISPVSANSGDPAFTMTLMGTNFLNGEILNFNNPATSTGSAIPTTFVSSTQLTALIPASAIILPGTYQVLVVSPLPPYSPSNILNFTVNLGTYPVPTITSITPTSAIAGSLPFSISASGNAIATGAVLNFNGAAKQSTVPNAQTILATISTADIATPGIVQVSITNPTPGGGTSASLPFTIIQPSIVPTITSISPATAPANTSPTVTITGTNFQAGATVFFDSTYYGTTVNSSTQLSTVLSMGQIPPGNYPVYVIDPAPTGGTSQPTNFVVTAPIPPSIAVTASGVTLSSATGASQTSTITVTPSGGLTGAVTVSCPAAASLPPGVSCMAPGPLNVTGASAVTGTVTLAVAMTSTTLTASGAEANEEDLAGLIPLRGGKGWWALSGSAGLGAILLLLLPGRKKYRTALGLSLLCVLSFALGCGGSGGGGGGGSVPTTTRMTVANAKVASGNPFAFTVTVTGGTPTGQVQLLENGMALASGSVVGGGASLTTGNLTAGTHSISARYGGDASTLVSSSGTLNVTVTGSTSVAITTNPAATPAAPAIAVVIN